MDNFPKVGLGVLIFKDKKILLGKRKGSHGAGEYAFPGGHLEYKESFKECLVREVMEECGIYIKNIKFQLIANINNFLPKHYIHLSFLADWKSGKPTVKEPEKCEFWQWYDLDKLPNPLFIPCKISIDSLQNNKNYYDLGDYDN